MAAFFVGDFEDSDCVVAQLDWDEKHVAYDLVQLAVDPEVVTQFGSAAGVLGFAEVLRLTCVEDLRDGVLAFAFEIYWIAQTARNHFAENRILNTII